MKKKVKVDDYMDSWMKEQINREQMLLSDLK